MLQPLEGSQALARAVALCRPDVVAAYPITPQTHIVENIAKLVADGRFKCELVSVESEFSAASVALGAVVAGSRAYTASSSQGLMLMSEVLFNIAGLRVPMVLTCANRAVGAPLNIWNDQQDSMAMRDSGWIQIYCADNQEAVDTTIQAFRIAERTELPVMVCVDGFTLTHTLEPIDVPDADVVSRYLPEFRFARMLDPANPISLGTLVAPEYFSEIRHSHHRALVNAIPEIESADRDFSDLVQRHWGGLLRVEGAEDARIGILAIGSAVGTLADARAAYPDLPATKIITLRTYRPFPEQALRDACRGLEQLVVVERALSPGGGGIVAPEVRSVLYRQPEAPRVHGVALGLGGRDIPLSVYPRLIDLTRAPEITEFAILDADLEKLPPEER